MAEVGAAIDTATTNESSTPVCAPATYPPKTQANVISSATRNMAAAASQALIEASFPSATSSAPRSDAVRYASARARRSPPKSDNTRSAKQPKTTKMSAFGPLRTKAGGPPEVQLQGDMQGCPAIMSIS